MRKRRKHFKNAQQLICLNTTRVDNPNDSDPQVGSNGLWLVKVSGGQPNQRFIMAKGRNLRAIDNELSV